jgi:branched-chain amino acid transport system permease protein
VTARPLDRAWLVLLVAPPSPACCWANAYVVHVVILIGIYGCSAGYQLVFGQLGGLSLAQGALFGIGAYATALLAPTLGRRRAAAGRARRWRGRAGCRLAHLRLQSHYFALADAALAALVNLLAVNWESVTGGANGLIGFGRGLPHGVWLLALVWLVLIAVVLLQSWLYSARRGKPRAWCARRRWLPRRAASTPGAGGWRPSSRAAPWPAGPVPRPPA